MFIPQAFAQSAAPATGSSGFGAEIISFAPIILMMLAAWFILFRPQQQRVKALQNAIAAVKKGDQVVTGGGIVGRVTKVEDAHVEVEIAANTRIRVVKVTLAEVTQPNAKPAND